MATPNTGAALDLRGTMCITSTEAKSLHGRMLKLAVGPADTDGSKAIFVHENVLCATSAFFKNAIKSVWKELREEPETINLFDDNFEIVNAYIHWLYFQKLPIPDDEYFIFLARAYVFGEKIMDISFKNDLMAGMIALCNKSNKFPSKVMNIIYEGTIGGSPMRRLLVDIDVNFAHEDKGWIQDIQGYTAEALADVLLAMVAQRPATKKRPWNDTPHLYMEEVAANTEVVVSKPHSEIREGYGDQLI
ncbi:hypothetical protein N0V90_002862 [Kalmusia sp. IMI 367209]|nr:hypothetical protein N0V90_002862 [Kalmusia sp. IMI 367209]